jgi:lysophospholipase L1-like esterase
MKRTLHDVKLFFLVLGCAWMTIGAAGLSGTASSAGAATRAHARGESATANAVSIPPGSQYVSIGSSLASGVGIPQQLGCGQSSRNYAHVVAATLRLNLDDVSCDGATIPDVLNTTQNGDLPPQIDAVTPDTRLITVGLGGNDIGYNFYAENCGQFGMCTPPTDTAALEAAFPELLDTMLADLKAAAPSAVIVVVTYPLEFPSTDCAALDMPALGFGILQQMGAVLESDLVAAAQRANVLLADPYSAPPIHTACGRKGQRWTFGLLQTKNGYPYHPTAHGHKAMATMILAALKKA